VEQLNHLPGQTSVIPPSRIRPVGRCQKSVAHFSGQGRALNMICILLTYRWVNHMHKHKHRHFRSPETWAFTKKTNNKQTANS